MRVTLPPNERGPSRLRIFMDSLRGREGANSSAADLRNFYESEYARCNPALDIQDAERKADALAGAYRRAGLGVVRSVLEVGCGSGAVLARMSAALGAKLRLGVDYGLPQARIAAATASTGVAVADAAALPFQDKSFDFAYFVDVLEHVIEPLSLLAEMSRVARRVGFLVPLEAGLVASPLYACRRIRGKPTNLEQYGHIWRWCRPEVLALLRKSELRVVTTVLLEPPPIVYTSRLGRALDVTRRLCRRASPLLAEAIFGGAALVGIAVPRDRVSS